MRQEQTAAVRERQSFNWQQRCGWRRRCFSFACPVLYLGLCSHPRSASSVPPLPLPCLAAASAKNSCSDTRFSQEVTPDVLRSHATGEEVIEPRLAQGGYEELGEA